MLVFERSKEGRQLTLLPSLDVPEVSFKEQREIPLRLPQVTENELSRHYKALEKKTHGVNDGFYPLGSCTMKYNPKINDEAASLPGFTEIHPLQPVHTIQGCLEALKVAERYFNEITGMDKFTFQPAAGAHGEFTGLQLMKAYHHARNEAYRTEVIIPDSAHGTNPASAAMAGYTVVSVPSMEDGSVNIEKLREAVGEHTAGLMLTNPNTVGMFDNNILEITKIVHEAGGLCYYDGANLNPVMGIVRPGDMGFDVIHLNLHKTFSTPHGGGGPGSGAVGCKNILAEFLPRDVVAGDGPYTMEDPEHTIGRVKNFYGNFLVVIRALTYLLTLGKEGVPEAAEHAVLNANYFMARLSERYKMAYEGICMHEFVMTLKDLKKETGVSALDISKGLLENGIHPPTMYFPLIVEEALMVEPTETETKETMDEAAQVFIELYDRAFTAPESLHNAPANTPVGRLDEVEAARHPKVKYQF